MRTFFLTFITCCILTPAICQMPGKPIVSLAAVTKNDKSILVYYNEHIKFSETYVVFDDRNHVVEKGDFLKKMMTGEYLPLELTSNSTAWHYKLIKLKGHIDPDVTSTLKQIGVTFYSIYKMEGKSLPDFHYVDMNGNIYDKRNTKGKIIVMNAWGTSCVPCVAEMPKLNQLTEKYKNRKDIIFISIATNSKKALEKFMPNHPFRYAVIPSSTEYAQDTLGLIAYPAHWIIGKNGIVKKMTYDRDEMIAALSREASK